MAIKELRKAVPIIHEDIEDRVAHFISQGGSVPEQQIKTGVMLDHRMTLRIPKELLEQIDNKRKTRPGVVSRNLIILEAIEKYVNS
jgi:hypothetical protein